jgi:D-cysteine desulfhydrase
VASSEHAPNTELALFRAYPKLVDRIERYPVLSGPTPVEPLDLEGIPDDQLFVKRDDHCSPRIGGNKPRKLEFVVGSALARRARRLVTTGGLGTHHGLATTIVGRDAGLATTLVLVRQPVTREVQHLLLLDAAYGARLVYGAGVAGAAAQVLRVLSASWLAEERPFLVSTGGSSTRGCIGIVSAALELAEQVREGLLPAPRQVYMPVGTGGTLAGLVAGFRLAQLPTRAVGVLVTDILPPSPRRLARLAVQAIGFLRARDPGVPQVDISPSDFDLVSDQLGPGYGTPTQSGREAMASAATANLHLDATYTAKCLAEIRHRARSGTLPGPVLFWNTHNGVDLAARAPRALDAGTLPPRFRRFVEKPAFD